MKKILKYKHTQTHTHMHTHNITANNKKLTMEHMGKYCRTTEMIHYPQNLGGITDVGKLVISEIR